MLCDDQAILYIDCAALAKNYAFLAKKSAPAETACAIKADAYGLGLEPVAKTLLKSGCKTFFIARMQEGVELRRLAPQANIYVLNGLTPDSFATIKAHELIPCLGSLAEITEWQAQAEARPAALYIDTGFNRLGLPMDDIDKIKNFTPQLVMSHLACADTPAHKMNTHQLAAFTACREKFPNSKASLANSAGVLMGKAFHFDMTRVGLGLYGGAPLEDESTALHTVVHLLAPILQLRHVKTGQSIGYGANFTATQDMHIAILALGYGDGFPRCLSGQAHATFNNTLCPIVGRISMDLLAIDITHLKNCPQRGDFVEMIGDTIKIDTLARQANTISYELLTQLGTRYKRQYKN